MDSRRNTRFRNIPGDGYTECELRFPGGRLALVGLTLAEIADRLRLLPQRITQRSVECRRAVYADCAGLLVEF